MRSRSLAVRVPEGLLSLWQSKREPEDTIYLAQLLGRKRGLVCGILKDGFAREEQILIIKKYYERKDARESVEVV
jgi:hypothetical protein